MRLCRGGAGAKKRATYLVQNRWLKFALLVVGWGLVGLLLSVEVYFNYRVDMPYVDPIEAAIPQFGRALMWALLAPLVLQLRVKVPLSRGRWVGGVAFHLAMSFVVMGVYYAGRVFSISLFWHSDFWPALTKNFYGRNIIDMAYYWLVLAFGYSLEIYQKYKSEELKTAQLEARLIETELKALREQLHPHFLFNTMNTIAVLVREGKNDAAVSLLARLSSLLRMSLDATRAAEITLRQEMDFLERYIDIQKARFSDRLEVEVAIQPEAMSARIPNLLLQPIVENAILHGVAPKTGPGRVRISGMVNGDQLHLDVEDDGPGILPDASSRRREGVGLANTRERLAKIYGARSQLTLKSELGRGVHVQIILPFRP